MSLGVNGHRVFNSNVKGVAAVAKIRQHMPQVVCTLARKLNGNVVILEKHGDRIVPCWLNLEPADKKSCGLTEPFKGMISYLWERAYGCQVTKKGSQITYRMNQVPDREITVYYDDKVKRWESRLRIKGEVCRLDHIWVETTGAMSRPAYIRLVGRAIRGNHPVTEEIRG